MFRRVTPEEWSQLTAIVGFTLTFLVFLIAIIKAWRMSRETARYMAARPLEPDTAVFIDHRLSDDQCGMSQASQQQSLSTSTSLRMATPSQPQQPGVERSDTPGNGPKKFSDPGGIAAAFPLQRTPPLLDHAGCDPSRIDSLGKPSPGVSLAPLAQPPAAVAGMASPSVRCQCTASSTTLQPRTSHE